MQRIRNADQDSRTSGSGWKRLVAERCTGPVCYCEERGSSFECECEDCPFQKPREVSQ
jgi:hypothetical protein